MIHTDAIAALGRIEAEVAALRATLMGKPDDERPIPLKQAAFEFEVNERTMRRYAEAGGGVKVRGRWYVYASQLAMPRLSANVR